MSDCVVEWADLPADLVALVGGELHKCREVVGLRSVCRWWRMSTPRPRNKISGLFPLKPSFLEEINGLPQCDREITAAAVYLVSRPGKPSTLVSVHEESAGTLTLRHPLYFVEIDSKEIGSKQEIDWATLTPIARSYVQSNRCTRCKRVVNTHKVAFLLENDSTPIARLQLVGLCKTLSSQVCAFRTELEATAPAAAAPSQFQCQSEPRLCDFVTFNGRIFGLDSEGKFYVLDHTSLHLIQIGAIPSLPPDHCRRQLAQFVVSDRHLYFVFLYYCLEVCNLRCLIYRLQVIDSSTTSPSSIHVIWEQVEELGEDTVFFIAETGSFSVSARLLPPPWKGNCLVYGGMILSMCGCALFCSFHDDPDKKPGDFFRNDPGVFFLAPGGGQAHDDGQPRFTLFSSLPQAYSDLFSPPAVVSL